MNLEAGYRRRMFERSWQHYQDFSDKGINKDLPTGIRVARTVPKLIFGMHLNWLSQEISNIWPSLLQKTSKSSTAVGKVQAQIPKQRLVE